MIEQLLSFSRIEAGQLEPRFGEVDLSALIVDAASDMAPLAQQKGVALSHRLPAERVVVEADRDQIRQVIDNLLGNGVKYTPTGGSVSIALSGGDPAELEVTDTGIGIPETDQERVFEKFYRVEQHEVEAESGTGLGLAIVERIVHAHGGRVELESQPGSGSCFRISLSRSRHKRLEKSRSGSIQ